MNEKINFSIFILLLPSVRFFSFTNAAFCVDPAAKYEELIETDSIHAAKFRRD